MQAQIPGYSIVSTLAPGNSSNVFLALDDARGNEVALKILTVDAARELGIIDPSPHRQNLIHPNIVKIFNAGLWADHYFIAMEYVSGRSLTHQRFEMDLLTRLRIVIDMAYALAYLESRNYIHGAVSPKNIVIRKKDNRAILCGFGVAQLAQQRLQDQDTDLQSLGLILYWLLTDYLPGADPSGNGIAVEDIPQLPDYLQAFQPIIDRMLTRDIAASYVSLRFCIADLEAVPQSALSAAIEGFEKALHAKRSLDSTASPANQNLPPIHEAPLQPDEAHQQVNEKAHQAFIALRHDHVLPPLEPLSPDPILDRPGKPVTPLNHGYSKLSYAIAFALGAFAFSAFIFGVSPKVTDPPSVARLALSEEREKPAIPNPIKYWPKIPEPALAEQSESLRKRLKEDFNLVVDLIIIYRAMQRSEDQEEQEFAARGIAQLQQQFNDRLREHWRQGNIEAAREEQALAQRLFEEKELLPELRETFSLMETGQR